MERGLMSSRKLKINNIRLGKGKIHSGVKNIFCSRLVSPQASSMNQEFLLIPLKVPRMWNRSGYFDYRMYFSFTKPNTLFILIVFYWTSVPIPFDEEICWSSIELEEVSLVRILPCWKKFVGPHSTGLQEVCWSTFFCSARSLLVRILPVSSTPGKLISQSPTTFK